MNIIEFVESIRTGSLSVEEHTHKVLEEARKVNKDYHYFNNISEELAIRQAKAVDDARKKGIAKGALLGVPVSVKDNICVECVESTAGSAILKGYKPLFNATAIRKAINEGAIIMGKTAQDEFGFGSFNTNVGVGFPVPKNPVDSERVCGGSSGGAAGWTRKTTMPHIAIAESTGGSIVCPASFCGVVGVCPTYGRVSRYGLMDYASSLDKIGVMARTVQEAALSMQVISGHDDRDSTSARIPVPDFLSAAQQGVEGLKVGVVNSFFDVNEEVKKPVEGALAQLAEKGAELVDVSLPLSAKYGLEAYYVLAMAEASTNLARYCGMRYGVHEPIEGNFDEYFSRVRSEYFGMEAKRRILLGTFARMSGYRDAFYLKALKVRTKIVQEYAKVFEGIDVLTMPTMPVVAPTIEEAGKFSALESYRMDTLTVSQNLAGLPHMSIPLGDGLPVGIQFIAPHFNERVLFRAGGGL